jgi:hypothetical protein
MSQDFNLKFDEYKENDPSQPIDTSQDKYPASIYARDVCFVLADGKMLAISYNYLVSKECSVEGNQIVLLFTTHTVTLKGSKLKSLMSELMSQIPRFIRCENERYAELKESDDAVVTEIIVVDK